MAAAARAASLAVAAVRNGAARRSWTATASFMAPRCAPVAVSTVRPARRLLHISGCVHDAGQDEGGITVTAGAGSAEIYPPSEEARSRANVGSEAEYRKLWQQSVDDPDAFWGGVADSFSWYQKWDRVCDWDFDNADIKWFSGAKLNVSVNCLDRHVDAGHGELPCMTFEADDGSSSTLSYNEVLEQVCRTANVLRDTGVGKGDVVTVYMSMCPQLLFTVLACARIGAVHSVVFGGFSAEALADRIVDGHSRTVVTADAGVRGGRPIQLKSVVDDAVKLAAAAGQGVSHVLVHHRAGSGVGLGAPGWDAARDVDLDDGMRNAAKTCEPAVMDAEDPLFILYTSGSTGKPKGVLHTQAGYMVYAAHTFKQIFDFKHPSETAGKYPADVHFCTADIGWITGHSYIAYGPLANGAHTVLFEGVPTYPSASRLWEICDKHKVTTFYTAPTALRALMIHGDEPVTSSKLDTLRILGTVGEPINPEAWRWYHSVVGKGKLPIVDTWWQTETGGIMMSPLPGAIAAKPGSATKPFFGIKPSVVSADGTPLQANEGGFLVIDQAWPGMMRSVYRDHDRFKEAYFSQIPGKYFTGDGARIDDDGDVWILGRTDDVLNVSGHRLSTAEVESALVLHDDVVEAAVVGCEHDVKGEAVYCFVTLKAEATPSDELRADLVALIRKQIGAIASPDVIHFTQTLPKTRSGKIMRRILRKVAAGDVDEESLGDTSTLADPGVVQQLIDTRPESN